MATASRLRLRSYLLCSFSFDYSPASAAAFGGCYSDYHSVVRPIELLFDFYCFISPWDMRCCRAPRTVVQCLMGDFNWRCYGMAESWPAVVWCEESFHVGNFPRGAKIAVLLLDCCAASGRSWITAGWPANRENREITRNFKSKREIGIKFRQ